MVAEQVFRRDPEEDVIRWRRLHGSPYKFGKAELYGGNVNLSMTAKQPPSCDGKVSWFRYEELVDDWVTITTAAKRGLLLKSRLTGDAYMYKAVLQNDLLFERCDQRVSVQTPQFLQPQKAEPRVPHFYIKIRNPSHEIEGSMDGLDANLYGTVSIIH